MLFICAVCCRYFLPVSSFVIYSPLPPSGPRISAQAAATEWRVPGDLNSSRLLPTVLEVGRPRWGRWQLWLMVGTLFLACGPARAVSSRGLSSLCVLGECGRAPAPSSRPMRSLIPPGASPCWPQEPSSPPRAPPPGTTALGGRASICEFWGNRNGQFIASCKLENIL